MHRLRAFGFDLVRSNLSSLSPLLKCARLQTLTIHGAADTLHLWPLGEAKPQLRRLEISDCPGVKDLLALRGFGAALEELCIHFFDSLTSLEGIEACTSLTRLKVGNESCALMFCM